MTNSGVPFFRNIKPSTPRLPTCKVCGMTRVPSGLCNLCRDLPVNSEREFIKRQSFSFADEVSS